MLQRHTNDSSRAFCLPPVADTTAAITTATITTAPRAMLAAVLVGALCAGFSPPSAAQAQATVKQDGAWRYAIGAGASFASGNTRSASVNLSGEAVRATTDSKFDLIGHGLYSKQNGETTAENAALGAQYDKDFTPRWFTFGKVDALRDQPANISSRASLFGGAGRHVVRSEANTFDVSVGLGYTDDRYVAATLISNELRTRNGRGEGLIAEESSHRFTPTTSLKQKLSVFPNLQQSGEARAVFDSGLSVAMTSTLSLTAGLSYRYDSNPGIGLKKGDALFVTGLAVKID
jgi:putative salt-induced outer membrane protein